MKSIVAGDEVILNAQGVRFVEKIDTVSPTYAVYGLRVSYRGHLLEHRYKSQQERDAQYDDLRRVLTRTTDSPEPTMK
jgi:hypothetical protein